MSYQKTKDKNYAINHGVLCGAFGGTSDEITARIEVPLDWVSIDKGLQTLVQTTDCRQKVLREIYGNDVPHKSLAIDLSNSELTPKTHRSDCSML